jgi:putative hydroxymethylpyrimidine transporter CytX
MTALHDVEAAHRGIAPLHEGHRRLGGWDCAVLWGDLGIGLLVLVAGALLVPALSLPQALLAIVVGSVLGCFLLALGALAGAREGVATMVLLRPVLGVRGSWVPSALNVAQLVGWTAFELWAMATVASVVSDRLFAVRAFGWWLTAATLVVTALALWGPVGVVRGWMVRFSAWVTLGVALLVTIALVVRGVGSAWSQPGAGGLSFASAVDLVVAMPISWLPLVADYNRFARRPGGSFWGTFGGYLVANIWLYALGALLVLQPGGASPSPEGIALGILALGGTALTGTMLLAGLLAGETDEAFADLYSAAVSLRNIAPRTDGRIVVVAVSLLAAAVAGLLSMDRYELFLFLIGSVFVPLFGVWAADYFFVSRGSPDDPSAARAGAGAAWLLGFAVYHWIAPTGPAWWVEWITGLAGAPLSQRFAWLGASVPAFLVAFAAHLAAGWTRRCSPSALDRSGPPS